MNDLGAEGRGEDDEIDGIDWLDPEPVDAERRICWRCGKSSSATLAACPYCRAQLAAAAAGDGRSARSRADDSSRLLPMIYLFLGFLATSVVYGWTINFGLAQPGVPNADDAANRVASLIVVELVDTVLVVAGIFLVGRPDRSPTPGTGRRAAAWLVAPLLLAVLLVANIGYHRLLKDALGLPETKLDLLDRPELLGWVLVGVCIQPAIVEELFFRYLALGHLRSLIGQHGAVLVSGVMFGLAHIFAPLSMPYLTLVGVVVGYLRIWSGNLLLPIFLHFAHNFAVLWLDKWL